MAVGNIVVIGNEKGGTGKTTIAVNLAAMAVSAKIDTLLVDSDPGQESAYAWASRRHEAHPDAAPIKCVVLTGRHIAGELKDLATRYRLVIVDTGASDSPELRAAATVARKIVVPLQPESIDLWALPTVGRIIADASVSNRRLKVVIAVNRIPHQQATTATTTVMEWILANVPTMPATTVLPLIGRAAYGRATGEGLGVAEVSKPNTKAVEEMTHLYNAVMS